jgi:flagellin-like protein
MNTIRKIRKSTKALSPVVASIILIAVTVAVSIAVAAWMGALTIGFMGTEEVKVTGVTFFTANSTATLAVQNTGTSPVTLTEAHINNGADVLATDVTIQPNAATSINIPVAGLTNGYNYNFQLRSAKGNAFPYTASAPS